MTDTCRRAARLLLRAALSAALGITLVQPCAAFGLGEARTSSRIGDFLRVEIPLQAGESERFDPDCFRLGAADANAADGLPWLTAARISVETTRQPPLLVITSNQPVRHPAIMVAIRVECGASLRRAYALLLDPPVSETAAVAPPVSEPTATTAAPVPAPTSAAPKAGANVWSTAEGETPRGIAAALHPDSPAAQRRFLRALRQANPQLLGGRRDSEVLPPGSSLAIPDAATVRRASAAPAAPETPPTQRAAASLSDEAPRPQRRRAASPSRAEERPRLLVGGGEEAGLRMSSILESREELSETERERLRSELQLVAILDDKIATQLELTEKLRQLEAMQADLQEQARRLEAQMRSAPQPSVSAPAEGSTTRPPAAGYSALSAWPWLLGAGLLVLVLAIVLLAVRRTRRNATEEEAAEHPAASPQPEAASSADMEGLFEPLSEEDIWPDQPDQLAPPHAPRLAQAVDGALGPLSQASLGPASILHIQETEAGEEHDSAVELAEIMMSFGRVHGAAQTLADFIRANPKQAVKPWIKLLEVYRAASMRAEFDALTAQLNKTFNVKPVSWDDFEIALQAPESLENMPHIVERVCETWGKRDCQAYLHGLLRDNRQGTRQGFPLAIVDEILLLLAILESYLGAYRADQDAPAATAPEAQAATIPAVSPAPIDTPMAAISGTLDFELDLADFSRTLHINLDELDPDPDGKNGK